ncbi:Xylose isomerase domain-containing protein TIM barrel [Planctomycetales bacterium 10988]|nr:Xylose isomerase domain-containing protein TIM barrel [Planctomycetales bacterium 10988]
MSRLSMNEVTTYRWTFEEDVLRFHEAGFQSLGVWRQKFTEYGEEQGIALLKSLSMKVSNLVWTGGFTGSDGRTFREGIQDAIEGIQQAAAMKADCLVVYSGGRGGHTNNHAWRLFREALSTLIPFLDEHGVSLAIEPMHPYCADEWTILTTLEETSTLLESFNHPRIGLVFDTYHLGFEEDWQAYLPRLLPYIRVVHVGDGMLPCECEQNRCLLGCGALPVAPMIQALEASGYQGHYDIELIGKDLDEFDYHEIVTQSKATLAKWLGEPSSIS